MYQTDPSGAGATSWGREPAGTRYAVIRASDSGVPAAVVVGAGAGALVVVVVVVEVEVLVVVLRLVVALAPVLLVLVLKPRPALAQHAKVMVGELEIIFGLDAVPGELRVARHALVFLEQLGGIAALAIVLAVPRLSAEVLAAPLSPAAPTAAALSIVDQMPTSLRS